MKGFLKIFFFLLCKTLFSQYSWTPVGSGMNYAVFAFATDTINNIFYTSGEFDTAGSISTGRIAQWNGVNWDSVGAGLENGYVSSMTMFNGQLYAGGSFTNSGAKWTKFFSRWNGVSWDSLFFTTGTCNVQKLQSYNNQLYVGGKFQ